MSPSAPPAAEGTGRLRRELGLLGLAATGICAMLGAGINVLPIMIQRNVPGIGPYVLLAYGLAVVPAVLAALSYGILASAMPRAGGSYVYASRGLSPFWGFAASFSQWFGLSVAIGVVAYVLPPFLRDIAAATGRDGIAAALDVPAVRLGVAFAFLWCFTAVNLLGLRVYERTLVPLMALMFAGGLVVIPAGLYFDHDAFAAALLAREGIVLGPPPEAALDLRAVLGASVILFSTFIGFDAVAQAGGEARRPDRSLPLAIGICIAAVGSYYILFTAAIYHAVPWHFLAERALETDLTAPGLLGYLLPPAATVVVVAAAAVALANDLPAMILSNSRLLFAWAEDGVFPSAAAAVDARRGTPYVAILASSLMASAGIVGNHLAGDFFLGVDLLVTSMLVNFFLMCLTVLVLPRRNPALAARIRFVRSPKPRAAVGAAGAVLLGGLLVVQILKDLRAPAAAWYLHATYAYLLVMAVAGAVFAGYWRRLGRRGVDRKALFSSLPPD